MYEFGKRCFVCSLQQPRARSSYSTSRHADSCEACLRCMKIMVRQTVSQKCCCVLALQTLKASCRSVRDPLPASLHPHPRLRCQLPLTLGGERLQLCSQNSMQLFFMDSLDTRLWREKGRTLRPSPSRPFPDQLLAEWLRGLHLTAPLCAPLDFE